MGTMPVDDDAAPDDVNRGDGDRRDDFDDVMRGHQESTRVERSPSPALQPPVQSTVKRNSLPSFFRTNLTNIFYLFSVDGRTTGKDSAESAFGVGEETAERACSSSSSCCCCYQRVNKRISERVLNFFEVFTNFSSWAVPIHLLTKTPQTRVSVCLVLRESCNDERI
jgi:hypothetical protein